MEPEPREVQQINIRVMEVAFDQGIFIAPAQPGMRCHMFNRILAAFFGFVLSIGPGLHAAAAATNFNGLWVGSWSSTQGDGGGLEISITQTGTTLSGQLTAQNANECGDPLVLQLTGTVIDNDTATFSKQFTDTCINEENKISLTANRTGNTLNGSYSTQFFENNTWHAGESGTFSLNRDCCTITASAGTGGGIAPSGTLEVAPGANQTFTMSADTGFRIDDVVVDSVSKGALSSYTFNNIVADHLISVTFAKSAGLFPFLELLLDKE